MNFMLSSVAVCLIAAGDAPTPEQTAWVKGHAIPLASVQAGHGFDDLQSLKQVIGDARIVALGEPTHGTREAFQFKHRLVEFLASEMGFTIFAIEASMPESCELTPWVLGQAGEGTDDEAASLIGGMYFWTWNTEEVLNLVKWMRSFNAREKQAGGQRRIEFAGFDMQTPDVAMKIVQDFVDAHARESAAMVGDCYAKARKFSPDTGGRGSGAGFGVATGSFPVDAAKGRKLVYSGWIKTRDVQGGYAGLWWRCDGKDGATRGFDNMAGRGPSGTTDWTRYEISMDIPQDITNINFGMILPGRGEAWFDDLKIELDGQAYSDPEKLCLDFEREDVRSFSGMSRGYQVARDDHEKHGGKKSLKINSTSDAEGRDDSGAENQPQRVTGAEAARLAKKVLEELREKREVLINAAGAKQADWAIQNARIVWQCYRMFSKGMTPAGLSARDTAMADNVEWLLEQNPGAKIVLWAHNGHVARQEGWMGSFLQEKFPGREMVVVGFATGSGAYTAMSADRGGLKQDLQLASPPPDSVEAVLGSAGLPRMMIDLREAALGKPGSSWAREPRPLRSIGAIEQFQQFYPVAAADLYDVMVYLDQTSAAVQLKSKPGRTRP